MTGCQDSTEPQADGSPSPEESAEAPNAEPASPTGLPLVAMPEHNLHVISAVAVNAFRAAGGRYRAGHLTHDVTVTDGIIEITPLHAPDGGEPVRGGTMTLRTGTIEIDGVELGSEVRTRLANGVVELDRGAVVETITNREDGIEQAWRFDARPAATGDLTISVSVAGERLVAQNHSGLHFQSDQGLGFRYSDGLWIDATGTETPIPSRFIDGRIVLTVPQELLASSQYPAVLDPTVAGEAFIDTAVAGGGAGASQVTPSIAFDGTNYLVVWSDTRLSRDADIFGTRVTPAGQILDANNIAIATGPGVQSNPVVAFANKRFVVAWEDFKVTGGTEANIAAAIVSTSGIVTQLGTVAGTAANETKPAIAGAGTRALLAWQVADADVFGAMFNGATFGASFPIAATANVEIKPAISGNPNGNFLAVWSEGETNTADVRGSFVTITNVVNPAFNISAAAGRQFEPAATFDGTNHMVVWTNNRAGIDVFGTRVSPAGVVLDTRPEGTATVGGVAVTTAANTQQQPKIACNAGGCVVVWLDERNVPTTSFDLFAQRMSSTFTRVGTEIPLITIAQPQQLPAVAADTTNILAVWQDLRDAVSPTVIGAPIASATGAIGAEVALARNFNRESSPAIGIAGGTNVLAWGDTRNGSPDIMFVRFTGNTKLDANVRSLSTAPLSQSTPAVASSSASSAYVVWSDSRNGTSDIFGNRVNADGTLANATDTPIAVAAAEQLVPAVAANANGTAALVVWQDRRFGPFDILGALLDASGNVVVADIVISNAAGNQTRPAVAFDSVNNQWVVVWSDGRDAADFDIFATRVSATGVVLDPAGIEISSPAAGSQFSPKIAFNNGTFLAVWEDRRNGTSDIFGTRLRAGSALTILDPNSVSYGGTIGQQTAPAVIPYNASGFLVAWQDTRNAATTGTDIFGLGVGANGAVNEPEIVISNQPGNETDVTLSATATAGVARIAYQRFRTDLNTTRIASRLITTTITTGKSCSIDAQCGAGGQCVDLKCCDSACGGNNKNDCLACSNELTGQPDGTCAVVALNRVVCRKYADTFCDVEEKCNGVDATCPDDLGRRQGVACTIAGGGSGTCPLNSLAGAPHVCQ
ncbi:MAG: hypothetical protein KIT31_00750 [Deltaproteobacteria bacterium]|nr:hypothetical protein [Deltaproteobacteria bacterium]